jgi:hypothetical protein
MSRLYLRCVVCSRQQADGLISGASWGRLELPNGVAVEHPALSGTTLRACPACISGDPDWQTRVLAALGLPHGHGPAASEAAQ